MRRCLSTRGFTVIEVLIASAIAATLLVSLSLFLNTYLSALSFSGTVDIGSRVVPAAPNFQAYISARGISSSLKDDSANSVTVLAFPGCIRPLSAGKNGRLPSLAQATANDLASPERIRSFLIGRDGLELVSNDGMTIICLGPNYVITGTYLVGYSIVGGADGGLWRLYQVYREGPKDGAWGRLESYEFAEPSDTPQTFEIPTTIKPDLGDGLTLSRGVLYISLPDPSRDATQAAKAGLPAPESTIHNVLPFP